jgi:hypothetical protein
MASEIGQPSRYCGLWLGSRRSCNSTISRLRGGLGWERAPSLQGIGGGGAYSPAERGHPREGGPLRAPSRTPTRVPTPAPEPASPCLPWAQSVFGMPPCARLCRWLRRPGNAVSGVTRIEGSNPSRSDFPDDITDYARSTEDRRTGEPTETPPRRIWVCECCAYQVERGRRSRLQVAARVQEQHARRSRLWPIHP